MTNQEFNQILSENNLVFCKFGASWCGPCKAMTPIVDEIAKEYEGAVKVMDIDVEESPELATQFKIRNVPTMIFFKEGNAIDKLVGSVTKATITEKLNNLV